MKLKKLELRTLNLGEKERLEYAALVRTIVTAPGQAGLSCDEMLKAVSLQDEIDAAVKAGADHVLLNAEQANFLTEKLETFRWGRAHPAFVEFIRHVRELPLVEVAAKE